MNRKGFTLIELLAVIVILAIIAIIATPIVLNIIKDASESAAKESATAYIKAVEQGYVSKLTKNEKIENGEYTIPALDELGIKVKGDKPSGDRDYVTLQNGKAVEYELTIKEYTITYKNGDLVVDSNQSGTCTDIDVLDYTVKFMVDGELYQSTNVKSGQKINAPVDKPTKEGEYFSKWLLEGENIIFPYEPTKNIEINALFTTTRDEITYDEAGDVMFAGYFDSTNRTATKTNDGKAVVGYCTRNQTGAYFACYVGETAESVQATNLQVEPTQIEYDGKIYYYSSTGTINRNVDTKKAWYIGSYDGYVNTSRFVCNPNAIIRLLDYYYRKIDS